MTLRACTQGPHGLRCGRVLVGVGLLLSCGASRAQIVVVSDRGLGLDEATSFALANHPALKAARQGVAIADTGHELAGSMDDLKVAGSATVAFHGPVTTISLPNAQTGQTESMQIGSPFTPSVTFAATKPLNMRSQKGAANRQTDAQVQVAQEDVRRAEQSVVLGVTQAFYNVLRAEHLRLVAIDGADRAETYLRIAEAKYGAGTVAQYDVDRARMDVASAKARLTQAEGAVRVALTVLARAMGLDPSDRVQIKADLLPEFVRVDEGAARKLAADRPDMRRLNWQIMASRAQIDSIRLEDRPVVAAYANTGYSSGTGFTQGVNYTLGLQATWPIVNGHNSDARVHQAEETIRSIELTREDKTAEINTAIRTALEELATARASVADAASAVTNARIALERVLLAYENNVGSWIDLRDARSGLLASEETFVTTLFQYRLAQADLEYAIGSRDLKGVLTPDPSLRPAIPDMAGIPKPTGAPPIPESGGLVGRSIGAESGDGATAPPTQNGGTR